MSRRLGLRLIALALPVAFLAPAAAHAEKVTTTDANGDTVQISYATGADGEREPVLTPMPWDTSVDIVRTVVEHGTARLGVTTTIVGLDWPRYFGVTVAVKTPAARFSIHARRTGRGRLQPEFVLRGTRPLPCRGVRASVDDETSTVAVSLPTSCLDAPEWVRVGVGAYAAESTAADPTDLEILADDAHRRGDVRKAGVTLGPQVRRG